MNPLYVMIIIVFQRLFPKKDGQRPHPVRFIMIFGIKWSFFVVYILSSIWWNVIFKLQFAFLVFHPRNCITGMKW